MIFVVDANILFSFFRKDSATRQILLNPVPEFLCPEFVFLELDKYADLIKNKSKISEQEYEKVKMLFRFFIKFYDAEYYHDKIREAEKICPDKSDIDFFALALKQKCFIWSNDRILKNQNEIKIFSTKEMIDLLDINK